MKEKKPSIFHPDLRKLEAWNIATWCRHNNFRTQLSGSLSSQCKNTQPCEQPINFYRQLILLFPDIFSWQAKGYNGLALHLPDKKKSRAILERFGQQLSQTVYGYVRLLLALDRESSAIWHSLKVDKCYLFSMPLPTINCGVGGHTLDSFFWQHWISFRLNWIVDQIIKMKNKPDKWWEQVMPNLPPFWKEVSTIINKGVYIYLVEVELLHVDSKIDLFTKQVHAYFLMH